MKTINSKDNKIYKICRELTAKKFRDKRGQYLIEGENLIEEALKNQEILRILLFREGFCAESELRRWDMACGVEKTVILEKRLFDCLAQTKTSQGIMAVVSKRVLEPDAFFTVLARRSSENMVILDQLQDPGNIGTIIRTADAAGYGGIIVIKGTSDLYAPKVVRAAAGSLFRVPVLFINDEKEVVRLVKSHGFKLVATCFDTKDYYCDVDLSNRIALIIGNEGNGISRVLIESSDCRVKIPMSGNIDSLNAAVAAGILMYESVRGSGWRHFL